MGDSPPRRHSALRKINVGSLGPPPADPTAEADAHPIADADAHIITDQGQAADPLSLAQHDYAADEEQSEMEDQFNRGWEIDSDGNMPPSPAQHDHAADEEQSETARHFHPE